MNDKVTRTTIFGVMFIIVLVSFYAMAISSKDEIMIIITMVFAGFLLLLNIGFMIKNSNKTRLMKKKIMKKEVLTMNHHPLEVFLINKIWHHKKDLLSTRQIHAGLLYSIKKQELIYSEKGLKINADVAQLSEYSRKVIEMAFLNEIECKQSAGMKSDRLNKIKAENKFTEIAELKTNMKNNCKNRNILFEMIDVVKGKYFTNIEGNGAAFLMILTVFTAILEFVLAVAFVEDTKVEVFYISVSLSIVLIGTITSKYRERVTLQENKIEEISNILNYIDGISKSETNEIDQIYLYSLNKLVKIEEITKNFME